MNRKGWLFGMMLVVALAPFVSELAEARRGSGRGGGVRISRSHRTSMRSVRNSSRPTRSHNYPRSHNYRRTTRQDHARPSPPARVTTSPAQQAARDRSRPPTASQRSSTVTIVQPGVDRPEVGSNLQQRPYELSTEQRQNISDRVQRRWDELSLAQQQRLQGRYDNARDRWNQLTPEEREKWLERRDEVREDRQDFIEDIHDDWWKDRWWYGRYPHRVVVYAYRPCTRVVYVSQRGYYYCDYVWYDRVYYQGEVNYVVVSAPSGAELTELDDAEVIEAGGEIYYLSHHTFYQKIQRDGKDLYVVVDPPIGLRVSSIPEMAVKVEVGGQEYYRYDNVYYQPANGDYIIVPDPQA